MVGNRISSKVGENRPNSGHFARFPTSCAYTMTIFKISLVRPSVLSSDPYMYIRQLASIMRRIFDRVRTRGCVLKDSPPFCRTKVAGRRGPPLQRIAADHAVLEQRNRLAAAGLQFRD